MYLQQMGIQDIHLTMAIFIRWRSKTSTSQWFRLLRPAPGRQGQVVCFTSTLIFSRWRSKASTLQWSRSRARHLQSAVPLIDGVGYALADWLSRIPAPLAEIHVSDNFMYAGGANKLLPAVAADLTSMRTT